MTEQKIQKQISDALTKAGWHVVKIIKCNKPGTPDIVACKGSKCVFIEVKRPEGKLSKLQEFTHKQMRDKGLSVIVAFGVEDIKGLL
jgi:Holliday junction resolvase